MLDISPLCDAGIPITAVARRPTFDEADPSEVTQPARTLSSRLGNCPRARIRNSNTIRLDATGAEASKHDLAISLIHGDGGKIPVLLVVRW
ncbi:hypothetical protein EsH8_III_000816 [Colletotrichum jinshuiense]